MSTSASSSFLGSSLGASLAGAAEATGPELAAAPDATPILASNPYPILPPVGIEASLVDPCLTNSCSFFPLRADIMAFNSSLST